MSTQEKRTEVDLTRMQDTTLTCVHMVSNFLQMATSFPKLFIKLIPLAGACENFCLPLVLLVNSAPS